MRQYYSCLFQRACNPEWPNEKRDWRSVSNPTIPYIGELGKNSGKLVTTTSSSIVCFSVGLYLTIWMLIALDSYKRLYSFQNHCTHSRFVDQDYDGESEIQMTVLGGKNLTQKKLSTSQNKKNQLHEDWRVLLIVSG